MKNVLIITVAPAPYKVDFYNQLSQFCNLTVVFEGEKCAWRQFNWIDYKKWRFRYIFLKEYLKRRYVDFKISSLIDKNKYDVIIITAYYTWTGQFALYLLKSRKIEYWFETDGAFIPSKESAIKRLYKRLLIKGAAKYLSPSETTDAYLMHYGASKESINRYPFASTFDSEIAKSPLQKADKKIIKNKYGIKEDKIIIAVGQFIRRKGFDVLIKAIGQLGRSEIGCYIIGGEPTSEYLELIDSVGAKNIHFIKFLGRDTLSEYYRASDVFVLPTREDIWGLVINEAMSNGLPVITTNKCNAGLALVDDNNGAIVPVDDVDALRYAIDRCIDNEKLESMCNESIKRISKYSIEEMAKVHANLIND